MRTALSIAGSDSSGGAGIQADIKTMSAHGVFAMTAVTALTAQNTTGVTDILDSTPAFLSAQLDAVFTDIFPDAVKIGMVSSAELISVIAQKLRQYNARHIVVDPVMVATSGSRLLREDAVEALKTELLPLAEVATPNIPEAEILADMPIRTPADMENAARSISEKYGCAVLCKGGHKVNDADDLLWPTSFGGTAPATGSTAAASTIPTPTAPAAPCPVPSPPIWRRAWRWRTRYAAPRSTSPARWRPCWIWDTAGDP